MCAVFAPQACTAAVLRQHACVRIAMEARCVERVGGVEGGFHAKARLEFVVVRGSTAAMGAHVTPVFFRLQTFFLQIDERIDGKTVVLCASKGCTQTKTGGRSRPRIAVECSIAADYFGSSTLSMTWMTPLLWYTLAMATLALLPFASVTVTWLPIALNVSGSPCTVV